MDFYFPRSGIHLTAIPKNGCTSVMTFFTALEFFMSNKHESSVNTSRIPKLDYSFLENCKDIHQGNSPIWKYRVKNPPLEKNRDVTNFLVLRNPYQRFSSFWFNKVFEVHDFYYAPFALNVLPILPEVKNVDMQKYAEEFILSLDIRGFLDAHIRPQFQFLSSDVDYDLILETNDLSKLPSHLSNTNARFRFLSEVEIPRLNESESFKEGSFFSSKLIGAIDKFYEKDFDLMRKYDLKIQVPEIADESSANFNLDKRTSNVQRFLLQTIEDKNRLSQQRDELAQQRDELAQQRDELAQQHFQITQLHNELAQQRNETNLVVHEILNSKTWKFFSVFGKIRN